MQYEVSAVTLPQSTKQNEAQASLGCHGDQSQRVRSAEQTLQTAAAGLVSSPPSGQFPAL